MTNTVEGHNPVLEGMPTAGGPELLHAWCRDRLSEFAGEIHKNPLTNSVQRLAHALSIALEEGQMPISALAALAKTISDEALEARITAFRRNHPRAGNADTAIVASGQESFEAFRARVEPTRAGIVFTGHPTFALNRALRQQFGDAAERPDGPLDLSTVRHRPDDDLSLFAEHDDVSAVIDNLTGAMDRLNASLINTAKERFPDDWHRLVPQPVSLASWVGYDLDGRTDIHWAQTLTIRLREKARQLSGYAKTLETLAKDHGAARLAELCKTFTMAHSLTLRQAEAFAGDLSDPETVIKAANLLTAEDPAKLFSLDRVIEALTEIIDCSRDDSLRRSLCLLRAKMKALGLGQSRIHLRINAAQIRSTLRHDFGVQDEREFMGRSALQRAAELAETVESWKVNFAAVFLEPTTARRQLMLCAQMLKHIDADMPIRFLIAECESPATVMGAVYLARSYGIADCLDISPLFETPSALERGGRFMERLLDEPAYVDAIRARGRIAIQLGFSDSGRFMGQIAADMAIERLHILLARALKARGITNVEVLIFNTNGESLGRGTAPGTIQNRFDHLITPWTRQVYGAAGLRLNVEGSFQGGEGFLHFQTPELAFSTLMSIFNHFQATPDDADKDEFYSDINFSWDLYRGIKAWQENLFERTDYNQAVSAFAHRFLFQTGSRKARRQKNGVVDMRPRALRAIPHNAILQQMALPANVACGIGAAIRQETERFVQFTNNSRRMTSLVTYAACARDLTSLPAFLAYATLYNPTYWSRRAAISKTPEDRRRVDQIAEVLAERSTFSALHRLANHVARDLGSFDDALTLLEGPERSIVRREERIDLHILHAIRQALIIHALLLITELPPFSGRHDIRLPDLLDQALDLDLDGVVARIDDIFPVSRPEVAALSAIKEETTLDLAATRGYPDVQESIREPVAAIADLIREIGVGISHYYGAYG